MNASNQNKYGRRDKKRYIKRHGMRVNGRSTRALQHLVDSSKKCSKIK